MKKIKLSGILDFIFGTSFVFLICFIWARYFLHNQTLSILLCAVVTFCIVGLFYFVRRKKVLKNLVGKTDLEEAHNIATHFLLCTKPETIKEFYNILSKTNIVKIKGDMLLTEKVAIRPLYNSTEITDKDVLDSFAKIKNTSIEKLIICCQSANAKAREIANIISDKKIVIYTEYDAYKNIFKPVGFKVESPKKPEKLKTKQRFLKYGQIALNKTRTKSYLMVSVILLFSSFVLRYNVYYLIVSTITVCLALYSHFNTKFNTKNTEQIIY